MFARKQKTFDDIKSDVKKHASKVLDSKKDTASRLRYLKILTGKLKHTIVASSF